MIEREPAGIGDLGAAMVDAAFAHVEPSRGVRATIEDSIAGLWSWYQQSMSLYAGRRQFGHDELVKDLQRRVEAVLEDCLQSALDAESRRLSVTASDLVELTIRRFDALAFGSRTTGVSE